jgi:hypothetical protein
MDFREDERDRGHSRSSGGRDAPPGRINGVHLKRQRRGTWTSRARSRAPLPRARRARCVVFDGVEGQSEPQSETGLAPGRPLPGFRGSPFHQQRLDRIGANVDAARPRHREAAGGARDADPDARRGRAETFGRNRSIFVAIRRYLTFERRHLRPRRDDPVRIPPASRRWSERARARRSSLKSSAWRSDSRSRCADLLFLAGIPDQRAAHVPTARTGGDDQPGRAVPVPLRARRCATSAHPTLAGRVELVSPFRRRTEGAAHGNPTPKDGNERSLRRAQGRRSVSLRRSSSRSRRSPADRVPLLSCASTPGASDGGSGPGNPRTGLEGTVARPPAAQATPTGRKRCVERPSRAGGHRSAGAGAAIGPFSGCYSNTALCDEAKPIDGSSRIRFPSTRRFARHRSRRRRSSPRPPRRADPPAAARGSPLHGGRARRRERQTLLSGLGELHLDDTLKRMRARVRGIKLGVEESLSRVFRTRDRPRRPPVGVVPATQGRSGESISQLSATRFASGSSLCRTRGAKTEVRDAGLPRGTIPSAFLPALPGQASPTRPEGGGIYGYAVTGVAATIEDA